MVLLLVLLFPCTFAVDCTNVTPQISPQANYDVISKCLSDGGLAGLAKGVYPLTRGIKMPVNSALRGVGGMATLVFPSLSSTNYMVSLATNSSLNFLSLNGNRHLPNGCCSAGILVNGDISFVHDVEIYNIPNGVGVYFIDKSSKHNHLLRVHIHDSHYGVIFADGLDAAHPNTFESGIIEGLACDSCTFAGYGIMLGNTIRNNGFNCGNGNPPIPGGGYYCLGNIGGGVIVNNHIYDNCGMLLDVDACAHFNVTNNVLENPGNTFGGKYAYCEGSLAASLIDCESFHVEGNTISNERASNQVGRSHWGDPNRIFSDVGAGAFSDLPAGPDTVVNFVISHRPNSGAKPSISNTVINNKFQCGCSGAQGGEAGCVGVGYYSGRGTGWDASKAWKPSMFTSNNPFGSSIGSKRCGGNWYAGKSQCKAHSPPPCNTDDYQHPTPPYRNDPDCGEYSGYLPSRKQDEGKMRVLMPLTGRT